MDTCAGSNSNCVSGILRRQEKKPYAWSRILYTWHLVVYFDVSDSFFFGFENTSVSVLKTEYLAFFSDKCTCIGTDFFISRTLAEHVLSCANYQILWWWISKLATLYTNLSRTSLNRLANNADYFRLSSIDIEDLKIFSAIEWGSHYSEHLLMLRNVFN